MNREDFAILREEVHGRPLVYLDNAATSQKPQQVIDAIVEAYSKWNSNIHRGVHHLSQLATAHHEEARKTVAAFIGAQSSDEIVFTKGTTDSLNALAFSLGEWKMDNGKWKICEGDEIIISGLEHHSNIVPWQMLCARKGATLRHIPLREDLTLNIEAFARMLSERTKLVSVAHVSNVLGTIQPVEQIIEMAHQQGALVCIDGAQSVPHMKVDVQALDCDFLAFSGHKMYGPTGIGVLYGKQKWLKQLPPHEGGGEMIEHVYWDHTTFNELPYKFEAGTPNFVGSYALQRAIEYMQGLGLEAIEAHERELTTYCEQLLSEMQGVKVYAAGQPKAGVISFNLTTDDDGTIHPFDVGTLLDQQGIAVRTGHHCAEPLIRDLGLSGTVRVSFGLYNDKRDVEAFIQALKRAQSMLM